MSNDFASEKGESVIIMANVPVAPDGAIVDDDEPQPMANVDIAAIAAIVAIRIEGCLQAILCNTQAGEAQPCDSVQPGHFSTVI